jgi:hypothetical protein
MFPRFHNCCKQRPISYKLFLCPRCSWHHILYTIFGVWNYVTSFNNGNSFSTTVSSTFCWIGTWFCYFYKLQITMWSMFVLVLPFSFGKWFFVIDLNCYNHFAHIWILTFFHQVWIYKTREKKNPLTITFLCLSQKTTKTKKVHRSLNFLPQIHSWG